MGSLASKKSTLFSVLFFVSAVSRAVPLPYSGSCAAVPAHGGLRQLCFSAFKNTEGFF